MNVFPYSIKLLEIPPPKHSDTLFNHPPKYIGPFLDITDIISPIIVLNGQKEYIISSEVGESFPAGNKTLELKSKASYSLRVPELVFVESRRGESINIVGEVFRMNWEQYRIFREKFRFAFGTSVELIDLTEEDFSVFATMFVKRILP